MKCIFCPQGAEVHNDNLHVCQDCWNKLQTHTAITCDCGAIYWLERTQENILAIVFQHGVHPDIASQPMWLVVKRCRRCAHLHDFSKKSKFQEVMMQIQIRYELYNNGQAWRVMRVKYILTPNGWLKTAVRCIKICTTRQEAEQRQQELEANNSSF